MEDCPITNSLPLHPGPKAPCHAAHTTPLYNRVTLALSSSRHRASGSWGDQQSALAYSRVHHGSASGLLRPAAGTQPLTGSGRLGLSMPPVLAPPAPASNMGCAACSCCSSTPCRLSAACPLPLMLLVVCSAAPCCPPSSSAAPDGSSCQALSSSGQL